MKYQKNRYYKVIDFYRALSVSLVFFYHLGQLDNGFIGVDFFFIISGFLITKVLSEQFDRKDYSIKRFLVKRAKRILPLILVTIIVVQVVFYFYLFPDQNLNLAQTSIANIFFISNYFFLTNDIDYFSESVLANPLFHTWSLSIEIQYYIFFALFFLTLYYLSKKKFRNNLKNFCFILIILYLVTFYLSTNLIFLKNFFFSFYSSFTRTILFILGSLIFQFDLHLRKKLNLVNILFSFLFLSIGFLTIIYFLLFIEKINHPEAISIMPSIGFILVFINLKNFQFLEKLLSNKIFIFLGKISFSIYCVHVPVIIFYDINDYSLENNFINILLITLIISYFTFKLIENKFHKDIKISTKKFGTFILSICSLVLLCSYFISYLSNNFLEKNKDNLFFTKKNHQKNFIKNYNIHKKNNYTKIIIIGDSYSQDFLNILMSINPNYEIRIIYSNVKCNPFKRKEKISLDCYFLDDKLDLLKKSNLIYFAFNWDFEKTQDLKDYLDNNLEIEKKSIIVGKKYFGRFKKNKFKNLSIKEKSEITNDVSPEFEKLNKYMKNKFKKFIDLKTISCPSKYKCKLFTKEGQLISFDGGHLTTKGSKYFSEELKSNTYIKLISQN